MAQPRFFTRAQMSADLAQLRDSAKSAWSYADYRRQEGVDLDELCVRLQASLPEQASAPEFFGLLQEFAAGMHDGHAWVAPNPGSLWALSGRFRDTDQGIVVEHWAPPGECVAGERLLAINGVPAEECVQERLRRASGSTEGARRSLAVRNLSRLPDASEVRLELENLAGQRRMVSSRPQKMVLKPAPAELSHRWLDQETGYLRLSSFLQDRALTRQFGLDAGLQKPFEQAREAFASLQDCKSLVIDLRGNMGGSDRLGLFLAGALLPEGSIYYHLQRHPSPELTLLLGGQSLNSERETVRVCREPLSPPYYSGRLVFLCDEDSFSAADCLMTAVVKNRADTLVVGRPNGAGAGDPRPVVRLRHSQVTLTCCVMQVWDPEGVLLEGHSLDLDRELRPNQRDLAEGRDVQLEAALELLRSACNISSRAGDRSARVARQHTQITLERTLP